jgi:hypothetical protein
MEITLDEITWHSDDRLALANFLSGPTGVKFLPKLAELAPTLLAEGETNKVLIRAGTLLGTQEVIRNILTLARPEPAAPQTVESLPDLLDDSKWDGEKLNPAK